MEGLGWRKAADIMMARKQRVKEGRSCRGGYTFASHTLLLTARHCLIPIIQSPSKGPICESRRLSGKSGYKCNSSSLERFLSLGWCFTYDSTGENSTRNRFLNLLPLNSLFHNEAGHKLINRSRIKFPRAAGFPIRMSQGRAGKSERSSNHENPALSLEFLPLLSLIKSAGSERRPLLLECAF